MFAGDRRAIVEGAHVRDDARVVLSWQRADHIREHIVRQPSRTVVGGLACPHPVTRDGCVTTGAAVLSRASYHTAKRVPLGLTDRLGCQLGRVVESVFNLSGVLKVCPLSVERI